MYFQAGGTAGYVGIKTRENSEYSIFYILGILNHKALEWVASKMASKFEGDYIAHGGSLLRDLPIKKIDFHDPKQKAKHDKIAETVKKIIQLHKDLKKAKTPRERTKITEDIKTKRGELEGTIDELYEIKSLIKYADLS